MLSGSGVNYVMGWLWKSYLNFVRLFFSRLPCWVGARQGGALLRPVSRGQTWPWNRLSQRHWGANSIFLTVLSVGGTWVCISTTTTQDFWTAGGTCQWSPASRYRRSHNRQQILKVFSEIVSIAKCWRNLFCSFDGEKWANPIQQ